LHYYLLTTRWRRGLLHPEFSDEPVRQRIRMARIRTTMTTPQLTLYNTLTRTKQPFTPLDANNVRMYVCGPTVYDFAHIGNARPVIVFDLLFRLLRHVYGADYVTYVRNITDVEDRTRV